MAHNEWLKISYRDFYDVPRLLVVTDRLGHHLLLSSDFNDAADEYSPTYTIYELSDEQFARTQGPDWSSLASSAAKVGEIPIAAVRFDPSKRRYLHVDSLSYIVRADIPPRS